MSQPKLCRIATTVAALFAMIVLLGAVVSAQSKVEGLIKSRNGETMTLQTSDAPALIVVLTDR
jgi:hypothetical protein